MNPCPCGYRSDPRRACSCTPPLVEKYLSKISGPLLDRIDLHVEVPAVPFTQLAEMPPALPPLSFAPGARSPCPPVQTLRPQGPAGQRPDDSPPAPQALYTQARGHEHPQSRHGGLGLSARAHDKVLRVARTIADLESSDEIKPQHIAKAVGYRSLDRSVWM